MQWVCLLLLPLPGCTGKRGLGASEPQALQLLGQVSPREPETLSPPQSPAQHWAHHRSQGICPIIGWMTKWVLWWNYSGRVGGKTEMEGGSIIPHWYLRPLRLWYGSSVFLSSFYLDFVFQESNQMPCWRNKKCLFLLGEAKFCNAKWHDGEWTIRPYRGIRETKMALWTLYSNTEISIPGLQSNLTHRGHFSWRFLKLLWKRSGFITALCYIRRHSCAST